MTELSYALPSALEDGVTVWEPNGSVVAVNDAMERMLGFPRQLLIGAPFPVSMLRAPGGGSLPAEQLPACRVERTNGRVDQEYGIALPDGDVLWLAVRSAPTEDGLIASVFTPITEAEAKARSATRITTLVDASPDLVLEALVASAPDGIVMADADGRIVLINEQACTLMELGVEASELMGQDSMVLGRAMRRLLVDPERAIAHVRAVAATNAPVRFIHFECNDGRRVGFDFVPLPDGGRLWTFRDATHFKLVEEEQRGFLATMSHELKTPLSGIAGAAELLIESGLSEREHELAEVISDAAQSLTGLLRDVLDVSRAEAGREEGEASDYDPRRLLTSIAGVLRPSLRGRNLELLVDVDPRVPDALRGDPARVRQIVLNLASNAVKYTEDGVARIDAAVDAGMLKITVSDTGRGIAEEDLARLFEPWTRTHTRAWAGTGLGLSIARRLARAMGGDVTVVSALGEGSAFTLELPLEAGQATPEMGCAAARALVASKVLVAEDDAALRRLIGLQLERLGVKTVLVEHGQAAVDAVRRESFDAVLLDLRMPVMGGLEAAAKIRALDDTVPMLALTADTAAEDVQRCRAAGMDGHLAKPISLPALRTELDRRITPVLDDSVLDELADNLGGPALVDQMLAVYQGALAGRLERLAAASTPEELRDAAHALRSPSAAFGIARLASRLRRVEAAARRGTMPPLKCVYDTAAQADRALTTRRRATA